MYDQSAEAEPSDYTVAEVNGNKGRSSVGSALSRSSTATSDPVDLEARAVHSPMVGRATAAPVLTTSAARAASADRMSNLSKEEWQVFPDDMYALTNNKYTKAELTARTPWMAFLTDPVARALLVCAFVYVSLCQLFISVLSPLRLHAPFQILLTYGRNLLISILYTGLDWFHPSLGDALLSD